MTFGISFSRPQSALKAIEAVKAERVAMFEAIPAGTTLLLKGGQVLTPDADWNDPPRADVAIAGDKIVGICPDYRLGDTRNMETINARDHLVLPGFVNAHYHSHDVLAKGTLEEVPLETWRLLCAAPQYAPRSAQGCLRMDLAECARVLDPR